MATQLDKGHHKITNDLLQLIKWRDVLGEMKELRLYTVLANVWGDVSDLLNLDGYTRNNIETKYPGDSKKCIRDVVEKWSNDEIKMSASNYKCTWNGLCQLLEDLQLSTPSKQLQQALKADISSFNNNTQMPDGPEKTLHHHRKALQKFISPYSPLTSYRGKKSKVLPRRLRFEALELDKMTEEERLQLLYTLESESHEMIRKFTYIPNNFCIFMDRQSREFDIIAKVKSKLNLFLSIPPLNTDALSKNLKNATTAEDISDILSKCCSFFNYQLLETLFSHMDYTEGQEELRRHEKDLIEYAKRRICHFPTGLGIRGYNHAIIAVKLDDMYEGTHIAHLLTFHRKLCELLRVTLGQCLLDGLKPGCICVTLHLLDHLVKDTFPLSIDQQTALQSLTCSGSKIRSLSCEFFIYILADNDKKVTNELLQLIKWKDQFGQMKELRLYDILASVWRDVSDLLDDDTRKNIEITYYRDAKQCINEVIEKWSNDEIKLSANYKCTWNGICHLLEDLQLSTASSQLKEALVADISSFNKNLQRQEVAAARCDCDDQSLHFSTPFAHKRSYKGQKQDVLQHRLNYPEQEVLQHRLYYPEQEVLQHRLNYPEKDVLQRRLIFPATELETTTKQERRRLLYTLKRDFNTMMYTFADILNNFHGFMMQQSTKFNIVDKMKSILSRVLKIPPLYKEEKSSSLTTYLSNATIVEDISIILNKYCSFFNYQLLETIFSLVDYHKGKDDLIKLKKDLTEHANRKICHFPSGLGVHGFIHAIIAVQLDNIYEGTCIAHLLTFHSKLCELLRVTLDQCPLDGLKPGRICVTLHLLDHLVKDTFPLSIDQQTALQSLTCNGSKIRSLTCEHFSYILADVATDQCTTTEMELKEAMDQKCDLQESQVEKEEEEIIQNKQRVLSEIHLPKEIKHHLRNTHTATTPEILKYLNEEKLFERTKRRNLQSLVHELKQTKLIYVDGKAELKCSEELFDALTILTYNMRKQIQLTQEFFEQSQRKMKKSALTSLHSASDLHHMRRTLIEEKDIKNFVLVLQNSIKSQEEYYTIITEYHAEVKYTVEMKQERDEELKSTIEDSNLAIQESVELWEELKIVGQEKMLLKHTEEFSSEKLSPTKTRSL